KSIKIFFLAISHHNEVLTKALAISCMGGIFQVCLQQILEEDICQIAFYLGCKHSCFCLRRCTF
ncbi:MAG: hypothetical protein PHX89_07805, partial [bacterium]|nr:hypothetical protein [bacterium]